MKAFGSTDIGNVRQENEDDFFYLENDRGDCIAVVCDGIGGSAAGEVASHIAVHTIRDAFIQSPVLDHDYEVDEWIQTTFNKANDAIYYKAQHNKNERGMGTTCVGFLMTKKSAYIFNVGDSRVYADYAEGLIQMSEDHNVVSRLLRKGEITKEEARWHKQKNTLTNALGVWHVFQIDLHKIENTFQYILLSSDGLHGYVSHKDIQNIVEDPQMSLEEKTKALISKANRAGGYDNCTVVIVENDRL